MRAMVFEGVGRPLRAAERAVPHPERAPEALDAAIIFAPDGALIPVALDAVVAGGTVVCGGIHMSDIPSYSYEHLWHERILRSVANLTRADGTEFLELRAARTDPHTRDDVSTRGRQQRARGPALRMPDGCSGRRAVAGEPGSKAAASIATRNGVSANRGRTPLQPRGTTDRAQTPTA